VVQSGDNNVLNYPYFFNGGGVGVGDINNDGLVDVYFSGNQLPNRLYLNKGDFQFEDITEKAGVGAKEGWKTGVTMADINSDGLLDIYVSRSAMGDSTLRKNLLYINNGDLTFSEKADAFGIADNSYSTQASFFDYDKDGDLDLFVLNHSLPQYGGFSKLIGNLKNKKSKKFGSKLYKNTNGKYTDASTEARLINNVLSFGLGIAVSDLNADGWPDLYISNDFNEEDYMYLNNQDGTFRNVIRDATGHVSLFSMGSDIADINNDALPDIFTLDMMPETNERIKLSSGDDNYDKYQMLINAGFHHQSMRNMLQLNNGNGTFSEVGQLAGISNTDWSWSALFADFDGDGWKDLFVSNGYEKDYTNMQFLKFTVDEQMKAREKGTAVDFKLILDKMPAIEVGNYFFRNNGDITFTKENENWGLTKKFKSNGAAYADLDNDGDQDLLINVMNGLAGVFKNNTVELKKGAFLKIDLQKSNSRDLVYGTKVFVHTLDRHQFFEFNPDRGFQSCMYTPLSIGINNATAVDSIRIIWPDNKTRLYKNLSPKDVFAPAHAEANETYSYQHNIKPVFETADALNWQHIKIDTNDFKRQYLLPKIYSQSGPRMASGDVDGDGLVDIYVCGGKGQSGALIMQQKNGTFKSKSISSFEKDKGFHDEDAVFFDADNDKDQDLYVVSGGYFLDNKSSFLQDRLYRNDGKGNFTPAQNVLPVEKLAGSCAIPIDFDSDGDLDLFVGSRITPGQYPITPASMLLENNGKGEFTDVTNKVAPGLLHAGMVCDAVAADVNNDKRQDLIVSGEWMPVKIFINQNGKFKDATNQWFNQSTSGWWNTLLVDDFDNDGDIDVIGGNYGANNQYHVSASRPATLVYKDFNNDGQVDPFFCYYVGDKSYPYASRDEALGQVAFLKPRFIDYVAFANATMETMFKPEELKDTTVLRADFLKTSYFENIDGKFEVKNLPVQAQFSPVHAMVSCDVDNDGDKDVIMGGNETNVRVRIGKSDANEGVLLINNGKGNFQYVDQRKSGLDLKGDVRDMIVIKSPHDTYLVCGITGSNIKIDKLTTAR
jgi:hypothetical protein